MNNYIESKINNDAVGAAKFEVYLLKIELKKIDDDIKVHNRMYKRALLITNVIIIHKIDSIQRACRFLQKYMSLQQHRENW